MHSAQGDLPPLNNLIQTEGFGVATVVTIIKFTPVRKRAAIVHTNDATQGGAGGASAFSYDFIEYAFGERFDALFLCFRDEKFLVGAEVILFFWHNEGVILEIQPELILSYLGWQKNMSLIIEILSNIIWIMSLIVFPKRDMIFVVWEVVSLHVVKISANLQIFPQILSLRADIFVHLHSIL